MDRNTETLTEIDATLVRDDMGYEVTEDGYWFRVPQYPDDMAICPLCHLPEVGDDAASVGSACCHCWD